MKFLSITLYVLFMSLLAHGSHIYWVFFCSYKCHHSLKCCVFTWFNCYCRRNRMTSKTIIIRLVTTNSSDLMFLYYVFVGRKVIHWMPHRYNGSFTLCLMHCSICNNSSWWAKKRDCSMVPMQAHHNQMRHLNTINVIYTVVSLKAQLNLIGFAQRHWIGKTSTCTKYMKSSYGFNQVDCSHPIFR